MMNAKTLLAACLWLLPVTAVLAATAPVVQKKASHTPGPAYPAQAAAKNITGSGVCQVAFGTSGRVTDASMEKSTGADILDRNTLDWARSHWTGTPHTHMQVPITYQLAKPAGKPVTVHTQLPPYPWQAVRGHLTGKGSCRVTFGPTGQATKAFMAESTGFGVLDENTVRFALANWTGRPNTAVTVPIAYKLR